MHQYSIDRKIREKIIYIIVTLSVVISMLLTNAFANKFANLDGFIASSSELTEIITIIKITELVPNFFGVPAIYWILSKSFDKWLWKAKLIKRILNVPDLNGIWKGSLISSYNNQSICMKLEIKQTWNKIECTSYFDKSMSTSNVAAIYTEDSGGPVLYFGFHNQSNDVTNKMQSYDGYNILHISDGKLSGKYFNDRPNPKKTITGGNLGTIELSLNKEDRRH